MANEKKEKEDADELAIADVEESPYGIKKNLNANCNLKIKNFSVRAGKICAKFAVELGEKEILKGGDEIELKNVTIEEGSMNVKIPQLIQEIISSNTRSAGDV